ncbi:MAG TPA: M23 family metallopeptidase [Pyrinomonadaceae bacterium]|nr:M23 family metallopeptidase [Pyrinomonadaceae bacterium]
MVQSGSLAIFLTIVFGIFGVGLHGIIKNTTFAQTLDSDSLSNQLAEAKLDQTRIDYARSEPSEAVTADSGGPIDIDEMIIDEPEVESQLKQIVANSSPDNIPNIWAHEGKINNEFGFRRNPFGGRTYEFHPGMDIDGERGENIIAAAAGTVTKAGWQGGYGNMVEIDHGNGLITRYGHMSKLNVQTGDVVTRGQLIGFIGSTGRSTGPHLHYELRLNEHPINPRRFLPPEPAVVTKPD